MEAGLVQLKDSAKKVTPGERGREGGREKRGREEEREGGDQRREGGREKSIDFTIGYI